MNSLKPRPLVCARAFLCLVLVSNQQKFRTACRTKTCITDFSHKITVASNYKLGARQNDGKLAGCSKADCRTYCTKYSCMVPGGRYLSSNSAVVLPSLIGIDFLIFLGLALFPEEGSGSMVASTFKRKVLKSAYGSDSKG